VKTVTTKKIEQLLKDNDSPLPLEVIPNHMGINLCAVDSITWTKQDDGQLVNLFINFIPENMVQHNIKPWKGETEIIPDQSWS
jgi:hypothetical protein